jgi:carboxypeptidase T
VNLLRNNHLLFVPIVNLDGFKHISDEYHSTGKIVHRRKNMRDAPQCRESDWQSGGIDLNRNYGYKWGIKDSGSSPNECAEDYRGASAFSEPETQAVKSVVEANHESLKIAVNFHCFGNLFIHPFNYDDGANKEL